MAACSKTCQSGKNQTGPRNIGLYFDGDGDFRAGGVGLNSNDNYRNLFLGYFRATVAGVYEFGHENPDDRAAVWLDLDRDNTFELNGSKGTELVSKSYTGGYSNVTLEPGYYRYAVAHIEGTGHARVDARFKTPAGAGPTSRTRVPGASTRKGFGLPAPLSAQPSGRTPYHCPAASQNPLPSPARWCRRLSRAAARSIAGRAAGSIRWGLPAGAGPLIGYGRQCHPGGKRLSWNSPPECPKHLHARFQLERCGRFGVDIDTVVEVMDSEAPYHPFGQRHSRNHPRRTLCGTGFR